MKIQISLARSMGFINKRAAGCLFLAKDTRNFLVLLRSAKVPEPNTWGMLSGEIDDNEKPLVALKREIAEEVGTISGIEFTALKTYDKDGFKFYSYLALVDNEFTPKLNFENADFEWVRLGKFPQPMHPGFQWLLRNDMAPIAKAVRNI